MASRRMAVRALLALVFALALAPSANAVSAPYQTGLQRWSAAAGQFGGWQLSGVTRGTGGLQLDLASATQGTDPYGAGGYNGGNFYNGGSFKVGEATSPQTAASFGFTQAIPSWNASTPPGTWTETLVRLKFGTRWSAWYNLGVWAATDETIQRHSVRAQSDADAYVSVDTLIVASKKLAPSAFQVKLRLFSESTAVPSVSSAALAYSTTPSKPGSLQPGNPAFWNTLLQVPECSQMVYPDGGEVWCSPTSTSMVLGYWNNTGTCAERVQAAVAGTYDWIYGGNGNWPFNTAYAATTGLEGYVARFTSLKQAEEWVAKGVPVIFSYAWKKGELTGAPISSSNGHLAIIVGFDTSGNPIVNDPAAPDNASVQRTYNRAQLESLWLEHSGGTVYLVYPAGTSVP